MVVIDLREEIIVLREGDQGLDLTQGTEAKGGEVDPSLPQITVTVDEMEVIEIGGEMIEDFHHATGEMTVKWAEMIGHTMII